MKIKLHHILIICLIISSDSLVNAFDYITNHTLQCTQLTSQDTKLQANLSELWGILILHIIDKVCFLALCPIILICQIVVLYTFKKHSQLRAKPGNIFCGLVVIQTMLNIHLLLNAIFRTAFDHHASMPDSFVGFCASMAFISAFFSLLHFLYLIMFMFHTVFIFRFTLKKKSQLFWTMLHVFVILSSLALTIFFYFYEFMGLNFYGICGVTATRRTKWNATLPGVEILSSIIFSVLGIFTYIYFKKHMPGSEGFRRRKVQQGKIIFMYVSGFSFFLILMSTMNLMLEINCTQDTPIPQINVLTTIVNLSRLLQFCFLIFLILYNQRFRIKIKQVVRGIFQKNFIGSTSLQLSHTIQLQDVFFNEKLLQLKYRANQIDLLLLSQIYTIISGIYISYYEYFRDFTYKQKIRKIHYLESVIFCLDNKTIIDYQTQSRLMVKLKILPCQITIHAPKVFKQLLDMDYLHEVFQSFHIVDNSRKLSGLAQGKGGKSGQFFFFSADNKYVIKTITQEQFAFYTDNLNTFFEYFQQNTQSLLAKIYGLFTIRGDQMQRTYHLIVMKNILGCQKSQILRLYDLKGSKHDRQVLFSQIQMNQVSKMTLKDIDFINYESAINVSPMKSYELRQILRKDTIFLKSLNLLDYSLLVVRVRWPQLPQHHNFWGQFQRIPHYFEKDQYYHIGIIDYMQKWDFNKKSEKWWKNLMGKKDFSAQEPQKYQHRFMDFIEEITSGPVKTEKNQSRMHEKTGIQLVQVKQALRIARAVTQPQKDMDQHSLVPSTHGKQRSTNKI